MTRLLNHSSMCHTGEGAALLPHPWLIVSLPALHSTCCSLSLFPVVMLLTLAPGHLFRRIFCCHFHVPVCFFLPCFLSRIVYRPASYTSPVSHILPAFSCLVSSLESSPSKGPLSLRVHPTFYVPPINPVHASDLCLAAPSPSLL